MGRSKADLPFGNETLLQRVVGRLQTVVEPVAVVAAVEQPLPRLRGPVLVTRDSAPNLGPLAGIAAGLEALAKANMATAFVTACDVPFLNPGLVRFLLSQSQDYDIVVPRDDEHHHPLTAVYRVHLYEEIADMLSVGMRRPVQLFDKVRTKTVELSELQGFDPELQSFTNMNAPPDYRAALQKVGLPIPDWVESD